MFKQSAERGQTPLFLLLLLVTATAIACDTPVYRYAMYRWAPTPYEIYFFHEDFFEDQVYGEKDTQLHRAVERAAEDVELPANVALFPVNLFVDPQLRSVPPDVRNMWNKQVDKSLPKYMVVSPRGSHVFSGDLTANEVASFVTSPARDRMNHLLAEGRAGVFVLLTGKDKQANAAAEKVIDGLARDVAAGKIELYMGPQPNFAEPAADPVQGQPLVKPAATATHAADGQSNAASEQQIGVVKLARDDPQEKWLVEMLLTIESDLKDEQFENDPMIFVTYGRAHALPPYIGKGITRDNLMDVLDFITGACSCTVKEQNPGVDLLTRYDWDMAAEKLAEKFGTEEGNEGLNGPDQFFPELLVGPGKSPTADDQAASGATPASNDSATTVGDAVADHGAGETIQVPSNQDPSQHNVSDAASHNTADRSGEVPTSAPGQSTTHGEDPSRKPSGAGKQLASLDEAADTPGESSDDQVAPSENSWMYTLAIGVGIGLFLLIGASFVLFRKR